MRWNRRREKFGSGQQRKSINRADTNISRNHGVDVTRAATPGEARVDLIQRRDKANRRGHDMRFAVCHPVSSSSGIYSPVATPVSRALLIAKGYIPLFAGHVWIRTSKMHPYLIGRVRTVRDANCYEVAVRRGRLCRLHDSESRNPSLSPMSDQI